MSDEQATPPPALRLKPKLRPAEAAGSADASSTEGPPRIPQPPSKFSAPLPSDVPAPDPAKIRFKPRLEGIAPTEPQTISSSPASNNPADPIPAMIPPAPMPNPPFAAPAPPTFISPPAPLSTPPLFILDPPAPPPATGATSVPMAAPAPAGGGDLGKFKLKPKSPGTISPGAPPPSTAAAPPVSFNPPASVPPVFSSPVTAPVAAPPPTGKAPPPFPVLAPPGAIKPPVPVAAPVAAPGAPAAEATPPAAAIGDQASPRNRPRKALLVLVAVVVLAAGYFGWNQFKGKSATTAAPGKSETKKATPAPSAATAPTPSETLNKLAHAPANAINQAQEAIANRRASGQARVDAAVNGEDAPTQAFGPAPAAPIKQGATAPRAGAPATTSTNVSPNVTATTQLDAAPEANAAFRSFVANAKVSGVFQGTPARAVINGKLTRAGEVVDPALGISFDGVDSDRRQLVFKDRAGATVSRRF